MLKAIPADKQTIVDLLVKAFDTNISVNYAIKNDRKRLQRIKRLMGYSFEVCQKSGEIFITPEKNGVLMMVHPEKKRTTLSTLWLDFTLALTCIGINRIGIILKREADIKANHPENFIHLWYAGVEPECQGKGIGSSLLKHAIEISNITHKPIYLETSNPRNLPLYERFGFVIFNTLTYDHTLYLLKREIE